MADYARLTDEQAALLRDNRKRLYAVTNEVADLVSLFLRACPHIDPEQPDTCHVCRLYRMVQGASSELHGLPDAVDRALVTGPHPMAKGK